jgi:hypothetical protein
LLSEALEGRLLNRAQRREWLSSTMLWHKHRFDLLNIFELINDDLVFLDRDPTAKKLELVSQFVFEV